MIELVWKKQRIHGGMLRVTSNWYEKAQIAKASKFQATKLKTPEVFESRSMREMQRSSTNT